MNPFPNRLRPQQPQRPQLPDPNVGAAPTTNGGFDQRLQMMQQRLPDFAYDATMKWGPQVAAAMHARNEARKAARPAHGQATQPVAQPVQPLTPNPSGSPVSPMGNPFMQPPRGNPFQQPPQGNPFPQRRPY
jgi:hypothetical protein